MHAPPRATTPWVANKEPERVWSSKRATAGPPPPTGHGAIHPAAQHKRLASCDLRRKRWTRSWTAHWLPRQPSHCRIAQARSRLSPVDRPSPPHQTGQRRARGRIPREASSLPQSTIETALARFVRDCRRFVRAAQFCLRPPLAALVEKFRYTFHSRDRHRHRERCGMRYASRVVDLCRDAQGGNSEALRLVPSRHFPKLTFRRPLARQRRPRAEGARQRQPPRGVGVILVTHHAP